MTNFIKLHLTPAVLFLIISLLLLSNIAFSQGKVNFSGHWVVNFDKSELGKSGRETVVPQFDIQQSEEGKATLIVFSGTFEGSSYRDTLFMDRRQFTSGTQSGDNNSSTYLKFSNWSDDGKSAVLTQKLSAFTMRITYSLSNDGKTLIMERVIDKDTNKIVYDRKSKSL